MNGQQQVQIRASDLDLKSSYSNMMQITHSQEEFTLDFFNIVPGAPVGILSSRVIVSPGHLKRMVAALEENLKRYEERFGEVSAADAPSKEIGFKSS